MKFCNMAVVVPVDRLAGNDEALRAQVWGKVSELLLPALGKLYRQFNPSNGAWGHKLVRPFGVILGKQEPELFLTMFLAAQQAQQDEQIGGDLLGEGERGAEHIPGYHIDKGQ